MDLRAAVLAAFDKTIESGFIEQTIQERLQKTVKEIIDNGLQSYSEFGKQLTEVVKKSLALNGEIDLPSYSDAILKIIKVQMAHLSDQMIQRQIAGHLDDLLDIPPESITLSALVEQYIEHLKDRNRHGCHCHSGDDNIRIILDESDGGYKHLYLDEDSKAEKYRCSIQLGISADGSVYSLQMSGSKTEQTLFSGPLWGFQRTLFQMKVAGTKIVFDVHADELDRSYAEYVD